MPTERKHLNKLRLCLLPRLKLPNHWNNCAGCGMDIKFIQKLLILKLLALTHPRIY